MVLRWEKSFRIDLNAKRGSKKNPYMKEGDIVFVGNFAINTFSEIITEITAPFIGIGSAIGTFKFISGQYSF